MTSDRDRYINWLYNGENGFSDDQCVELLERYDRMAVIHTDAINAFIDGMIEDERAV